MQLWFQDNNKGISTENIRWLARVFGCDDPEATSKWQTELSSAQSRLVARRRALRNGLERRDAEVPPGATVNATLEFDPESLAEATQSNDVIGPKRRFSLAKRSEALFNRGSTLDIPAAVFAGAVALGFFSYFLGIHSVVYTRADDLIKQVGFLWAPNWTLLFMVFMPLYFAFVVELLVFWKRDGRSKLAMISGRMERNDSWALKVEAYSVTYWAVLFICLPIAGLLQWIARRLMPLISGDRGNYAIDWGAIAIVHPVNISVPGSILFTGLAYLYMSVCFYFLFVGLILLYTLAHEFWEIGGKTGFRQGAEGRREVLESGLRVMCGTFRCAILGVLVAICMKLQSAYVTSSAENILAWLAGDLLSVFEAGNDWRDGKDYVRPTHYSSLLVAMATCAVFLHGALRLQAVWRRQEGVGENQLRGVLTAMSAVVALLVTGYLLIGAFPGFSILLSIGLLLAVYGLFDPGFGMEKAAGPRGNHRVS